MKRRLWTASVLFVLLTAKAVLAESPQIRVAVEPAAPTADDEIVVTVAGVAGCPYLGDLDRHGDVFTIEVATGCPLEPALPAAAFDFEVPLGKLETGTYQLEVVGLLGALRARETLVVTEPRRTIAVSPSSPSARDPIRVEVTLEGFALCELFRGARVRGHQILIDYDDRCLAPPTAAEPPPTVSFEAELDPLGATYYRVFLRDTKSTVVATSDLVVQPADRCMSSEHQLCLRQGRFRAEVSWRLKDGSRGRGRAVPLGGDSGHFYFFREDNVEMVLKVLDACRPPYNSFWVFAAGLTDLETTLTITDLRSGERRSYHNPAGRSFKPVLDTRAFMTCP